MNISFFYLIICFLLRLFSVKSNVFRVPKLDGSVDVPALYVFGDSLVDSGNSNYLGSNVKADKFPYGVDFNCTTGRFTNGRNQADFMAEIAKLPYAPPYMGLSYLENLTTSTGVNYASGGCGMLRNTEKDRLIDVKKGACLDLDKQIELFQATLNNLKPQFKGSKQLSTYLSRSLFFINIGTNDLLLIFNDDPELPNRRFGPANRPYKFLLVELSMRLKTLYGLGARKFLVNNIGNLGCIPHIRLFLQNLQTAKFQPIEDETPCAEGLNIAARRYNILLKIMLRKLQFDLPGSKFVYGDVYKLLKDVKSAPTSYGISETNSACFDNDDHYKNDSKCSDFKNIDFNKCLFFDRFRPTQTVHFYMTKRCFEDHTICSPVTLHELMKA